MVEDVVGCKWSLAVLGLVRQGVRRPSAMEHAIPGLSKKVLNERLRTLGVSACSSARHIPKCRHAWNTD